MILYFGDGFGIFISKSKKIASELSMQDSCFESCSIGTLMIEPSVESRDLAELCKEFCKDFMLGKRYFRNVMIGKWAFATTPIIFANQFFPSMRRGSEFEVPDGIIGRITRECGGNVHDREIVEVTSSLDHYMSEHGLNWVGRPVDCSGQNVADLGTASFFCSAYHDRASRIPHRRNNWIYYDFKDRRILPTHYAIRSYQGIFLPKLWVVDSSLDGEAWQEIDRHENSDELKGVGLVGTFAVADCSALGLIRLVNIGQNHRGNDCLALSAWEIFGSLINDESRD